MILRCLKRLRCSSTVRYFIVVLALGSLTFFANLVKRWENPITRCLEWQSPDNVIGPIPPPTTPSPTPPPPPITWLYLITPTKMRVQQKADLVRLSQTLMHVPYIHWIVIEDAEEISEKVAGVLKRSGISHDHVAVSTIKSRIYTKGRGMIQRNAGLDIVRERYHTGKLPSTEGVVYFMDDDNTYDIRLFDMMRQVRKIGFWAVGFIAGSLEAPKIDERGKISGWLTKWAPNRPYAIDMAGFAVNIRLILKTNHRFPYKCTPGYYETCFLEQFEVRRRQLQAFGVEEKGVGNMTIKEVYVWHTRTSNPGVSLHADLHGYEL